MKRITLTAHDQVSDALRDAASRSLETAGVLLVGVSETSDELRLLAREYHPAPAEAYLGRTADSPELAPAAYMRALARAEAIGAIALFVHTHPGTADVIEARRRGRRVTTVGVPDLATPRRMDR